MKRLLIFATTYPYTAGIIALMWAGSVILLALDKNLSLPAVLTANSALTLFIAAVGFRK